jgi:hypothetical protein
VKTIKRIDKLEDRSRFHFWVATVFGLNLLGLLTLRPRRDMSLHNINVRIALARTRMAFVTKPKFRYY